MKIFISNKNGLGCCKMYSENICRIVLKSYTSLRFMNNKIT